MTTMSASKLRRHWYGIGDFFNVTDLGRGANLRSKIISAKADHRIVVTGINISEIGTGIVGGIYFSAHSTGQGGTDDVQIIGGTSGTPEFIAVDGTWYWDVSAHAMPIAVAPSPSEAIWLQGFDGSIGAETRINVRGYFLPVEG